MSHLPNCLQIGLCGCDLLGKSPISQVKQGEYKPEHQCTSGCNKDFDCPLIDCEHCNKQFDPEDIQEIGGLYYCFACAEIDERDSVSAILDSIEQENFKSAITDQGI